MRASKAPSSPARPSPAGCWSRTSPSRWMAGAASSTTSPSNGCGVAEVRGRVSARTPRRAGRGTDHRDAGRLLQRGPPALVAGRPDAGRGLPRWSGTIVRTMRRDAVPGAQPAQRHLRAWRDRRAPVPSAFPSGAGPDGKTEAGFKPGSGGCVRTRRSRTVAVLGPTRSPGPQPGFPRALETTGIQITFALGLSEEIGPPQCRLRRYT